MEISEVFVEQVTRRQAVALAASSLFINGTSAGKLPSRYAGQDLQAWLDKAGAGTAYAEIPWTAQPLAVPGPIQIPAGLTLVVRRLLVGGKSSTITLAGGATLRFENDASLTNVAVRIMHGSASIANLRYSGYEHLAAILIDGPGPFHDILLEGLNISKANFGILRQGDKSSLDGLIIRRCSFSHLRGDAIEWNVCPQDRSMIVEDIVIDTIDDPLGRPNWGIGIGFAGRTYDAAWKAEEQVKNFIIRRVKGVRVRQLIHVEAGTGFQIENITGDQISEQYSAKSNMPSAFICCYGCRNFSIDGVKSPTGDVLLHAGVKSGEFIVPSSNFVVRNALLGEGSIRTEMGGKNSYAKFINVKSCGGDLKLRGQVADLEITRSNIRGGPYAIEQDRSFLTGNMQKFVPSRTRYHLANVSSVAAGCPRPGILSSFLK